MADKPSLVHVEILGQTYAIRAGTEPGYVEQLASFVDRQMREVSRGTGAIDTLRVAVLAALNIADELFRERGQGRSHEADSDARARALALELERVLDDVER